MAKSVDNCRATGVSSSLRDCAVSQRGCLMKSTVRWSPLLRSEAPDMAEWDRMGSSVALFPDGTECAIDAPVHGTGKVYVFRFIGGVWASCGYINVLGVEDIISQVFWLQNYDTLVVTCTYTGGATY